MKSSAHLCGLLLVSSAGCATTQPCPVNGILATECRAGRGDKFAQLALGKAYESGGGVPQSFERAAGLYQAAATSSSETTYVYTPAVGKSPGQVIPIKSGMGQMGLAEAKYRLGLMYMNGRGVPQDIKRGDHWIKSALNDGYVVRR